MAITALRWLLVMAAFWLLAGCASADGLTRIEAPLTEWGDLPDFRSPLFFPGEVRGIMMNPFGAAVLNGNEICLHVDDAVTGDVLASGLPVEITVNMRVLARDEITITQDDRAMQVVYCFAPLLDIGRHTLDIDLNTRSGLQVYQYIFSSGRVTGWRPLSMYPGEITGMDFAPGDPYILQQTGEVICWRTNERVLPRDTNRARVLDVLLDGEVLMPEWIESQGGTLETCFILDLEPGMYAMTAVLASVDVVPWEVLPVTVEEWYRWTLQVDEERR